MLRAGQLLTFLRLWRCASATGVSPRRRQPATGLPGDYPDRTFTGWRTRACARVTREASPPYSSGCPCRWAHWTSATVSEAGGPAF